MMDGTEGERRDGERVRAPEVLLIVRANSFTCETPSACVGREKGTQAPIPVGFWLPASLSSHQMGSYCDVISVFSFCLYFGPCTLFQKTSHKTRLILRQAKNYEP